MQCKATLSCYWSPAPRACQSKSERPNETNPALFPDACGSGRVDPGLCASRRRIVVGYNSKAVTSTPRVYGGGPAVRFGLFGLPSYSLPVLPAHNRARIRRRGSQVVVTYLTMALDAYQ